MGAFIPSMSLSIRHLKQKNHVGTNAQTQNIMQREHLTSALEFIHKDDLEAALSELQKAVGALLSINNVFRGTCTQIELLPCCRNVHMTWCHARAYLARLQEKVAPGSYEVAMQLGFLLCALGRDSDVHRYLQRALPPAPATTSYSDVAQADERMQEEGDTVLESAVRQRLAAGAACAPMPLLYPSDLVVEEVSQQLPRGEGGVVGGEVTGGGKGGERDSVEYKRVYYLDRLDGEGSLVVKQTSSLAAAREAFVLLELRHSAGKVGC